MVIMVIGNLDTSLVSTKGTKPSTSEWLSGVSQLVEWGIIVLLLILSFFRTMNPLRDTHKIFASINSKVVQMHGVSPNAYLG